MSSYVDRRRVLFWGKCQEYGPKYHHILHKNMNIVTLPSMSCRRSLRQTVVEVLSTGSQYDIIQYGKGKFQELRAQSGTVERDHTIQVQNRHPGAEPTCRYPQFPLLDRKPAGSIIHVHLEGGNNVVLATDAAQKSNQQVAERAVSNLMCTPNIPSGHLCSDYLTLLEFKSKSSLEMT